jgi:hypothetical protein
MHLSGKKAAPRYGLEFHGLRPTSRKRAQHQIVSTHRPSSAFEVHFGHFMCPALAALAKFRPLSKGFGEWI